MTLLMVKNKSFASRKRH